MRDREAGRAELQSFKRTIGVKGDFRSEETKEMSSSSVVIKGLERKDREKAAEFVKRMMSWSMKTHLKGGYSKKSLEHDVSVAVQALDSAIKDPNYYCTLAIKDGKVVGVAIGQLVGGVGLINWMAVAPEHHRQGVGKKLMAAVEKQMLRSGCHKMALYVVSSHLPALGLYLKGGMVPEATLKEHLWGEDYVVMSKRLKRKVSTVREVE